VVGLYQLLHKKGLCLNSWDINRLLMMVMMIMMMVMMMMMLVVVVVYQCKVMV
jgi:hypothetical protein